MKKIINSKAYNTETATLVARESNGLGENDFNYCIEELYKTQKGAYFLYGEGGALSKYRDGAGNQFWGTATIIPLDEDAAFEWLEENGKTGALEKYFTDRIEEA